MSFILAAGGLVDPNPGLAIWTLVTFTIVFVVLSWKVWGPLMKMIEGREKTIQDAIDQAKKEREEAEKLLAEQTVAAEKARKETAELVRKSQAEVEAAKTELFAKAKAEADNLLAQARKGIEEEKRKALAEVRQVAVDVAIAAAGKLVGAKMDDASQRQLAEGFVADVAKEKRVVA